MDIAGVRRVFSKGSIVVNDGGIVVIYTHKGGDDWFSQQIEEHKRVFEDLIACSDRIGVLYRGGKFIKMYFYMNIPGQSEVFYTPMERQISLEEFREIHGDNSTGSEEFWDFMSGVDLKDDDAVFDRFLEWVDARNKYYEDIEKNRVFNLSDVGRWKELSRLAHKIGRHFMCNLRISELDDEGDGVVELQFPEGKEGVMWIDGDLIQDFLDLTRVSSVVAIDGNVTEGFLNIGFYM